MKEKQNGVKNKTDTGIGAKGIMKISEMMKTNSTLVDLNLSGTLISLDLDGKRRREKRIEVKNKV